MKQAKNIYIQTETWDSYYLNHAHISLKQIAKDVHFVNLFSLKLFIKSGDIEFQE